jgi:hypothetical protein
MCAPWNINVGVLSLNFEKHIFFYFLLFIITGSRPFFHHLSVLDPAMTRLTGSRLGNDEAALIPAVVMKSGVVIYRSNPLPLNIFHNTYVGNLNE